MDDPAANSNPPRSHVLPSASLTRAWPGADGRRHNLPAELSSFVGREQQVVELMRRLRDVRLLTLTGVGGVGKTRLAQRVAAAAADEFADGVCFVPLAPLRDPALVTSTLAQALGVREVPGRPLLETMCEALEPRELLLVLDNFEQVLGAAPLVAALLVACSRLKILVTSRAVLHLSGEQAFSVPPLRIPEQASSPSLEHLTDYEAVRLFIERARAARADFAADAVSAPAVAAICHHLDGLPLAIELAAARVRVLAPAAILARLGQRLDLLVEGPRDEPARHRTLRGAIAWSYDLLDGHEQALFRRLAVFVGGCALEAAEAVCAGGNGAEADVLNLLSQLVDKSLVVAEERGGEMSYRLLETIRVFGQEQLQMAGEAAALQRRHADYYCALAERAEAELQGVHQRAWCDRLEREHDNLRAALAWSLQEPAAAGAERAQRLTAIWQFWSIRGHLREGRDWLARALATSRAATAARALALCRAAQLALTQGEEDQATALAEECLAVARVTGEKRAEAWALGALGVVALARGQYEQASAVIEACLAVARTVGQYEVGRCTRRLGEIAALRGQFQPAQALLEENLRLYRGLGCEREVAETLTDLGSCARMRGDYRQARARFAESIALCLELEDHQGLSWNLEALGRLAVAEQHLEHAARLFGVVDALREVIGARPQAYLRADYGQVLAATRAGLGDGAFEAAWATGRALPWDQVVTDALATEKPAPASSAGGRPSSRGPSPAVLTRREREVAGLVARGLTNRQIAEVLVIAESTAALHVKNLLAKLHFASRAQVAAWAVGQGLAPAPAAGAPPSPF